MIASCPQGAARRGRPHIGVGPAIVRRIGTKGKTMRGEPNSGGGHWRRYRRLLAGILGLAVVTVGGLTRTDASGGFEDEFAELSAELAGQDGPLPNNQSETGA